MSTGDEVSAFLASLSRVLYAGVGGGLIMGLIDVIEHYKGRNLTWRKYVTGIMICLLLGFIIEWRDLYATKINLSAEIDGFKKEVGELKSELKKRGDIAKIIDDIAAFNQAGIEIEVAYETNKYLTDQEVWEKFRDWDSQFRQWAITPGGIGMDYYMQFEDESGLNIGEIPTLMSEKRTKYWKHVANRLMRLGEFRKYFRDQLK